MIVASFVTAYQLRLPGSISSAPSPQPASATYEIMLGSSLLTLLATFNFFGLYNQRRGVSRIDQFYRVTSRRLGRARSLSLALNSLLLGNRFIYSRQMLLLGWILCIALVTAGRFVHGNVVGSLRRQRGRARPPADRRHGQHRAHVLETIARSPWLGYEIVGVLAHARTPGSGSWERGERLPPCPRCRCSATTAQLGADGHRGTTSTR